MSDPANIVLTCDDCGKRFKASRITPGKVYHCNACNGRLHTVNPEPVPPPADFSNASGDYESDSPDASGTFNLSIPNANEQDPFTSQLFGDYSIEMTLGGGGMGRVYLARHKQNGGQAAIKVLSHQFAADPYHLKRFFREAKMAAELKHPNIVQLYDFGKAHMYYFIAMEYVDGEALQDRMKRERRIPIDDALLIHLAVLDGLNYAHQRKIVHRDIKPENIMITRKGEVKITDMGLARRQDPAESEQVTRAGEALGTPHFMAPEQATGQPIDARTDLYGVGVSFYYAVSGNFPYEGTAAIEILRNMLRKEPIPLLHYCESATPLLNKTIMKLISKKKDQRYADAVETSAALNACLREYTGEAYAPSTAATAAMPSGKGMRDVQASKAATNETRGPGIWLWLSIPAALAVIAVLIWLLIWLLKL